MKMIDFNLRNVFLFALFFVAAIQAYCEPYFKSELIFPLENWHNHASSIVECPNGNLLTVWFHGSGERRSDDVVIHGAKKVPGAEGWSQPFIAADTPGFPDCNPTIYIDRSGKLCLFWANILDNHWESALLKYRTANVPDHYQNMGEEIEWDWQGIIHLKPENFAEKVKEHMPAFKERFKDRLPDYSEEEWQNIQPGERGYYYTDRALNDKLQQRIGWMPRISPIELSSGRILLGLYTDAYSVSLAAYTGDLGESWQTSEPIVGFGNIQPSFVEKSDGTIVAFMRENGLTDHIRTAASNDQGHSWSAVSEMKFPNPGASVEVLHLDNGHWVLMYNNTTDGRHNLRLSVSDDEGKTWKWHRNLENVEPGKGSFSYPSMIQSKDGRIHVTYSYHMPGGKKSIKHCEFDEAWILEVK